MKEWMFQVIEGTKPTSVTEIQVPRAGAPGEEAVTYDPNPDDSQRQQVLRAAASCPVQAIILEVDPPADRDTK